MHVVLGVTESDAALNAFNWIKYNPLHLWSDLHLTLVHVLNRHTGSGVALLKKYELLAKNFAKTVNTKLLTKQKSVGQTLKEYVASLREQQPLLVIGSTRQKWKVIDYCVQRCDCPVMVVKRDYFSPVTARPIVALAMDVNVHCDRTFRWFLKSSDLPDTSQLYVVHITPKKTDKPDARRFLAALKPMCIESKRKYSMASALVSYDRGGVADGLIRFCHDKHVQSLMISSKGDRHLPRFRLSNTVTEDCLKHSEQDVLVWMDEQTRNVSDDPFIIKMKGTESSSIKIAPWDANSKGPLHIPLNIPNIPNIPSEVNQKAEPIHKDASPKSDKSEEAVPPQKLEANEKNSQKQLATEASQKVKSKKNTRQTSPKINRADSSDDGEEIKSPNSSSAAAFTSPSIQSTLATSLPAPSPSPKKGQSKIPPPPPPYPRPSATPTFATFQPNELAGSAPLAPIAESYAQPIQDPSQKRMRRKSSLKYMMYDSIAKGKNSLTKGFRDESDALADHSGGYIDEEPLSP